MRRSATSRHRAARRWVTALAGLLLTTACASTSPAPVRPTTSSPVDQAYLFGNVTAQREAASRRVLARNLAEYLPNQKFIVNGDAPRSEADVFIRGTVVSAKGVRGYYIPGGPDADAAAGTPIAFDDPRAWWRIIEVTVKVDDSLGSPALDEERFSITVDGPDHERLVAEAGDLGDVLAVLGSAGTYDFDKGLRRVEELGTLIGELDPSGAISFPALGASSEAFVGQVNTWPALKAEYSKTKDPIKTDLLGDRTSS